MVYKPRPKTAAPQVSAKEKAIVSQMVKEEEYRAEETLAKICPGKFKIGLENDGVVMPAVPVLVKTVRSITNCYDMDTGTSLPCGTRDFVVLMHCCSLTIADGEGAVGTIPATTKLGGLVAFQSTATSGSTTIACFQNANIAKTMTEIYGSQGNGSFNSAFVWSSQLEFQMISQQIGATGVAHFGIMPFQSFAAKGGTLYNFTIDDLIKMSSYQMGFDGQKRKFALQSALQNASVMQYNPVSHPVEPFDVMGAEVVSYVVLQKAYTKFSDGTNQSYSFSFTAKGNVAGIRRNDDTLTPAHMLSRGIQSYEEHLAIPHAFSGESPQGFIGAVKGAVSAIQTAYSIVPPELLQKSLDEDQSGNWFSRFAKKVGAWYENNKGWISPLLTGVAMVLEPQDDQVYVDADLVNESLKETI